MGNKDKGLNRGGTIGQEGELDQGKPSGPHGNLNQRDWQKQQGGIDREPNLEKDKKKIQPTHVVD